MPAPRLAIIGRPNVGKSSLMNMLARERIAIVDPTPGVTRDRLTALIELEANDDERPPITIELTDTGGWGVYVAEGRRYNEVGADLSSLTKDIELQISEAVGAADMVLLVVDTQAGVTPQDEAIAKLVRERVLGAERDGGPPPVMVIANKCDGEGWEAHAYEAAGLGFGEPAMVSAQNNYMRRVLLERLYEEVSDLPIVREGRHTPDPAPDALKIAIIGKRNAGKSTLVNQLAGEARVIVSEIAGTTRDAIDVRVELDGREVVAIDTAGLRRKRSFADRVEHYAFDRLKRTIERADVALLLIDATEPVSQVDFSLAKLVQEAFLPCVIVVNKWDLARDATTKSGAPITTEDYEKYLREEIKGLAYAPISFMSAKDGVNIAPTIELAAELHEQASQRVTTGKLNRFFRKMLAERGPSSKLGTFAKVYFVSQVRTNPPTIVLVVNDADLFTPGYRRYMLNRIREYLPFEEAPVNLIIRDRKRADLRELLTGAYARRKQQEPEAAEAIDRAGRMTDAELETLIDELEADPDALFDE